MKKKTHGINHIAASVAYTDCGILVGMNQISIYLSQVTCKNCKKRYNKCKS